MQSRGTLNLMSPMSDTRPGSPRLVCSKAVPASEPCLRPHPRHSHPRASFGARPSRFARADPHDGQRGWDLNSAAASAKVPKPVCLRQRRSAMAASSRRISESSASATLGRPSAMRGRATAPRVRGHREAARHLRQIGLRVVDHVITLREFRWPRALHQRGPLPRLRLSVRPGPRPGPAGPGATPPQPGGGLLERICPVGPFSIVPRRLAGGLVPHLPGGDVTERRTLRPPKPTECAFP